MNAELFSKTEPSKGWNGILKRAIQLIRIPVIIALLITPIRFSLELAGLPEYAIFLIGVLWVTLGFSIYWGIRLYNQNQPHLTLLLCLLIFSPISRIPVAILWWVDNKLGIGSHYGLYFDNFLSALLNQATYGSLIQVVPGFLLGSVTLAFTKQAKS